MDEKKREEISKQAKVILSKFAKSLEKVKFKEKVGKEKLGGFREEQEPMEPNEDFRKRIFDNAPNKDDDCIIAEKKIW